MTFIGNGSSSSSSFVPLGIIPRLSESETCECECRMNILIQVPSLVFQIAQTNSNRLRFASDIWTDSLAFAYTHGDKTGNQMQLCSFYITLL